MFGIKKEKKKLKKNTFLDYVACANHLVNQKYTYKGGICFYGGSAGGLTGSAVANLSRFIFFNAASCALCRYYDYNVK